MSNSVQSDRSSDRSTETDPTLAELMDPAALERRLTDARRRREEAIRAREERIAAGEAPPERAGFGLPPRSIPLSAEETGFGRDGELAAAEASAPPAAAWQAPPGPPAPRPAPDRTFPQQDPAARPPLSPLGSAPAAREAATPETQGRPGWTPPISTPPRSILAEQSTAARARLAEEKATARPATAKALDWLDPPAPIERPAPPTVSTGGRQSISVDPGDGVLRTPHASQDRTGTKRPMLWVSIFLIGLIGGGGAVLFAPSSLRDWVSGTSPSPTSTHAAPETARAPTELETPAARAPEPSPEIASAAPDVVAEAPDTPRVIATDPATPPALDAALAAPETGAPDAPAAPTAPDVLASIDPVAPAPPAPEMAIDATPATAPPAETPADTPSATPVPAETVEPAPEAAPGVEALASARISLNYPASAAGTATELAAALRAAGAGAATVVPVGFSVSSTNIRYYHPEDRAAAEAVAALVRATGPAEIRDFTNFRPPPLPGIIEVWLGGQSGSAGARATTPPPAETTPATTARTGRGATPARDLEAEEVERMLLSREVERMLRQGVQATQ